MQLPENANISIKITISNYKGQPQIIISKHSSNGGIVSVELADEIMNLPPEVEIEDLKWALEKLSDD